MNAKLDSQIAMKQKMKTILDADQYEKWENMKREQGKQDKQRKGGRN